MYWYWKTVKSLGLPNNISSCEVKGLKINNIVEHDVSSVLKGFENYYPTLADYLEQTFSKLPNKYSNQRCY